MPRIPHEVRFADKSLVIDGEEFPWYIGNEPEIHVDPETGVASVVIALVGLDHVFVNDRLVVDSGYAPDSA